MEDCGAAWSLAASFRVNAGDAPPLTSPGGEARDVPFVFLPDFAVNREAS
jgi:hypothetical protein